MPDTDLPATPPILIVLPAMCRCGS